MVFGMEPAAVAASAGNEAGLAAESAGVAGAAAGALAPPPMALDMDSARLAVLAAAAGQEHVAMVEQHAASRGLTPRRLLAPASRHQAAPRLRPASPVPNNQMRLAAQISISRRRESVMMSERTCLRAQD